jgi:hypothetical protein
MQDERKRARERERKKQKIVVTIYQIAFPSRGTRKEKRWAS